jgi:ribosomal protein S18 acetylase RimI-like enzyme
MGKERFGVSLEITIRHARRDDLAALEWWGWFGEHRAIIHDTFAAAKRGDALFLVAHSDRFPVGQVWVDLERAPKIALLWALRVIPGLRSAGIGRRLIANCERQIRAAGIGIAAVSVEKQNDRALALYERLGYRLVGEYRDRWTYADPRRQPAEDLDQLIFEKSLAPLSGGKPTAVEIASFRSSQNAAMRSSRD